MDTLNIQVEYMLEVISKEMKTMNLNAEKVFMNGDCGNLFTLLKMKFGDLIKPYAIMYKGIPYHIITKANDKFYDITGNTSLEKYIDYISIHNFGTFDKNDFKIEDVAKLEEQLKYSNLIQKMSDKYDYDEQWRQSKIENKMDKLTSKIKDLVSKNNSVNNAYKADDFER